MKKTIGIIGLGNMGSAIATCIAGIYPTPPVITRCESPVIARSEATKQSCLSFPPLLTACRGKLRRESNNILFTYHIIGFDLDRKKCTKIKKLGIKITKNSSELVKLSDIIILSIKPQEMESFLKEIKNALTGNKLIISIAAGISTKYIERIVGKVPVVRVMPNIAILVRESASAVCCGKYATKKDEKIALKIFSTMGKVFKIPEKLMDSVTALSGSGPAYFFEIINSFINAGVNIGLSQSQAKDLVFQTARGAITILEKINNDPVILRDMVTSKKGTTLEGLKVLWKFHLQKILTKAIFAAKKRAGELSHN